MMPATQPYAEITMKIRKCEKEINRIRKLIELNTNERHALAGKPIEYFMDHYNLEDVQEATIKRFRLIYDCNKIYTDHETDIKFHEWQISFLTQTMSPGRQDIVLASKFIQACPHTDCRGFLSTAWKCGVCENWTCPTCHEVKGPDKNVEHTCNPEVVASIQMLAKDSKNCPNCSSVIFKINGCDQMFCTQCHTAFSWRTGRIETGQIHNPHYYDYMRRQGHLPRNPGDVPCGGFPSLRTIINLMVDSPLPNRENIASVHRSYFHCQGHLIHLYENHNEADNRDIRILYILKEISEDEFKTKIQRREKARERKTEITRVIQMYMNVVNDIFQSFVSDHDSTKLYLSIGELRDYVNSAMKKISSLYNCVVPLIDQRYNFTK